MVGINSGEGSGIALGKAKYAKNEAKAAVTLFLILY